jgi:hypothetical protein
MAVGIYDEQIVLPHPPLRRAVLLVVEAAICAAWNLLRTRPRSDFDLLTAHEDLITHELHEALFNGVFNRGIVDGFDRQIFSIVVREPKVRTYDYQNLDKMPDLLIALVDRPAGVINTQHGIFIECKPVDERHGTGQHYCQKGVLRFVRGEYAWAMSDALMVAYTRSGYRISPKLVDALKTYAGEMSIQGSLQPCAHSNETSANELVHFSKHLRGFTYRENGLPASPITIRHLWLKRY